MTRRRKHIFTGLLILIILLVAAALLGPRVAVDTHVAWPELPTDLDAYLLASEGQYDDLIPGAEKTIVWADQPGERTALSVVYLHGFSATRQEAAPLADEVAAALGANLFYQRIEGHGRTDAGMAENSVRGWLAGAMEAYAIGEQLGERVVVMGGSTGGTAATWLATRDDVDSLAALVLLSPNFGPRDPASEILTWPWGETIARMVIGPENQWEPYNEAQGRYWHTKYPVAALPPMMALVKLTRNAPLHEITVPVFAAWSEGDIVVNPERTQTALSAMSSADVTVWPVPVGTSPDDHVIAGDIMAPDYTPILREALVEFLQPMN